MSNQKQLLTAARTLGIKGLSANTSVDDLRNAINTKLGVPTVPDHNPEQQAEITDSYAAVIAQHGEQAIASATGAVTANARNIPNLSPSGIWQGKRARIRRIKTGHNDMSGAMFNWNGWPTIIPLDAPHADIAWPIYEIMRQAVGIKLTIRQEESKRDPGRVQNIKEITHYDKYPFEFLGVTPGTESLPESAWEYTLDQYVEGFTDYTVRMWRQLCVLWELSDEQCKVAAGVAPEDEVVARQNAIHYHLNLPQGVDRQVRDRVRNEKRADIGMAAKAA